MGPEGAMMGPMMSRGGGLDEAWGESMGMRPPMAGAMMPDQLRAHMEAAGPMARGPGFFTEGPKGMGPMGSDWAQEFGAGPGPQLARPPMMRPPGADWAQEFAGPRPMGGMEAAFQQAQMEAAFAPPPMAAQAQMDAAFQQAAMSSDQRMMEAAFAQQMPPPAVQADMDAAFQEAQMEAAFKEADMEAAFAEAQQATSDEADLAQAAQMVEMLRNSGNPKFANSQFVSFIDKVSKGDLKFQENTVVDRDGNQVDWDTLYDTAAATASDVEKSELDNLWAASSSKDAGGLEQAWKDADPQLEEMWKAAASSGGGVDLESLWQGANMSDLAEAWRMAGDDPEAAFLEQAWGGEGGLDEAWNKSAEYQFQSDNQYLDAADPLAEAQRLLREGRDREALLALEAEVQKNPESSEGWRLLGQLYAELDQDPEAIQCLRRGHEVDPYNLDSLLALGVSCTNELDQLPALRYLRMWIENHEEHQVLVQGLEPPPDYEFEAWRQQVTMLFNNAAGNNPLDADVFVALGVMENINRNYDGAIVALATACRLRPNDHTVWNKLGATLANSGKSEQAVVAYHQGLQLKPNYARSWSNLAIAHANLGQHADAARFYLSSLVLNPEATHIWNFLHSAALNMNNMNAFEAIDRRDLAAASKMVDGVLDPANLPPPTHELPQPPDEILASIGL